MSYTKIYYCDHCVGETLHYSKEDSDGMWTCPSCGSGRRERDWSRGDALGGAVMGGRNIERRVVCETCGCGLPSIRVLNDGRGSDHE